MQKHTLFRRALVCLALLAPACGDDHTSEAGPPPTVSITVAPDTVTQGEAVTVTVSVENFELVPDTSAQAKHAGHGETTDAATQGHYHVYVDSLDGNPVLMGHETPTQLTVDATPGEHVLIVRLHDTTHRIIEPQITDEAALTVLATTGVGGGGGSGGASAGAGGMGGAGGGT